MSRFSLLPTVLVALFLIACSDSDHVDNPAENNALGILSAAPTPFGAAGGSAELIFRSPESWRIDTAPASEAWYAVNPRSGPAGERITVRVTVDPNEAYTPRKLTLTLHTASSEQAVVYEQLKKNAIIVGENRRELSAEAQELTVGVQYNVEYTVTIEAGAEWIAELPRGRAAGLDSREHRFGIAANPTDKPRTGTIVFRDRNSDLSDELTVVQSAWEDPDPERSALRAIYDAAGGGGWTKSDNWCTDKPLGEWYGVETDEEGHVVALRLPKNNLMGTISEGIARLTKLRHIDLSWNALEGELTWKDKTNHTICSWMDDLSALETIDLSHNRLTSEWIPGNWFRLERLQRIDLSSNLLQGAAIPIQWEPMFRNGRTVELVLNDNYLHGDIPAFVQNHPDWDRLALGVIRQSEDNLPGVEYDRDIHLPDFTYTDLRDGSQRSIHEVTAANEVTMLLSWDPTLAVSTDFMNTTVRRFHTLFSEQGFGVVAITPAGEEYAAAARSYLAGHEVAWPVVTDYEDAQGRRTVLPAYPYPSYILVDGEGKLLEDIFTGQYNPMLNLPGESYVFDLIERPFQHTDFLNGFFMNTFGLSTYRSTDFSMDKQYEALQTATRGQGIDIVLVGDAFTDIDIETGYYRQVMEFAMESFFALEPTKSYREYFNIWMVYAVSRNAHIENDYSGETALRTFINSEGTINNPLTSIKDYRKPNPDTPVVATIVNGSSGGVTYAKLTGSNYAFTGLGYGARIVVSNTFVHETVGHGFGLLADEYVDSRDSSRPAKISESDKRQLIEYQSAGRFLNVSLTNDPTKVYWSHLIGHPRYPYVSIYEGGYCFSQGVWRSEDESVMRSYNPKFYFNALGRQLIVKRILDLSGEGFTFEKFLEKDSDEGRPTPISAKNQPIQEDEIPYKHYPPILVV